MSVKARVSVTFPRGARTPENILWSGVVEWVNPEKVNERGNPERILRVQCSMVRGKNGLFLSMPYVQRYDADAGRMVAVKNKSGYYVNYVDLGPGFAKSGLAAVEEELAKPTRESMAARREAERQTEAEATSPSGEFDDLPF